MPLPEISLIIPAYREEENLRIVLPRLVATLQESGRSFEVLVVDSETPLDGTRQVCDSAGVTWVPRLKGNNYGDAVRTGIAIAAGRHIGFMDADGSHTPEFLMRMLPHISAHDIVIASRYVEGGSTENSAIQIWMSRILNAIYIIVLSIPCRDASNSFKIYRADLLKGLRLDCRHFDIVEEMLVRCSARRARLRIKEVPYAFQARISGKTKRSLFVFILSFCLTLSRLFMLRVATRR